MEPTFAEKMPPKKRRKIQAWSIAANCFGSLSEVMLDSSAILISYVALLDGNESLNMLMAGATASSPSCCKSRAGCSSKR